MTIIKSQNYNKNTKIKSENRFPPSEKGRYDYFMEKGQSIRVLERAFDILEVLTSDTELSLVEIVERTGLPLATVHRSIQTMLSRGYIGQDLKSGKYYLGMQIIRLSGYAINRIDLIRIATPHLQDISRSTGLNANLSIYDQGKALCLINIESAAEFMLGIKVGQRLPIYAGALSKVILAHLSPELSPSLLTNLNSYTPLTIASREALERELDTIRTQGFAVSQGELAIGVGAVAAPIFDYRGRPVAGIALSGPDVVFSPEQKNELIHRLLETSERISREMGYEGKH